MSEPKWTPAQRAAIEDRGAFSRSARMRASARHLKDRL